MTLRKKIVDHIARTISPRKAYDANTVLGLLLVYFAGCADGFVRATSEQLAEFLHSRGNAETTVARRLSTSRLIFAVLVEWSLIETNPAMGVDRPAAGDKAPDFEVSGTVVASLISHQRALVEGVRGLMIHTERLILALIHLVAAGVFLAEVKGLVVRDRVSITESFDALTARDPVVVGAGDLVSREPFKFIVLHCTVFLTRTRCTNGKERGEALS